MSAGTSFQIERIDAEYRPSPGTIRALAWPLDYGPAATKFLIDEHARHDDFDADKLNELAGPIAARPVTESLESRMMLSADRVIVEVSVNTWSPWEITYIVNIIGTPGADNVEGSFTTTPGQNDNADPIPVGSFVFRDIGNPGNPDNGRIIPNVRGVSFMMRDGNDRVDTEAILGCPVSVNGNAGNDQLYLNGQGTNGGGIEGGLGNDTIALYNCVGSSAHGREGNDDLYVEGGWGNHLHGEDGHDEFYTRSQGPTYVYGGAGDDYLSAEYNGYEETFWGGTGLDSFSNFSYEDPDGTDAEIY